MEDNTPYIYKECQRNHAAVLGKHSTDGCNQYVHDAAKPYVTFCLACDCHRNFHRQVSVLMDAPHDHDAFPIATNDQRSSIPTTFGNIDKETAADVIDIFSDDDDDEEEEYGTYRCTMNCTPRVSKVTPRSGRKRFTEEEKQKMRRVCKMLEWKMPGTGKGTEDVKSLCEEIGIRRDTFRKFMYKERPIVS